MRRILSNGPRAVIGLLLMFTALILVANQRMVVDAHPPNNSLSAADGSPTNALWIDAAGSVGIGTTTPAELLDVNGRTKAGRATTGPWPANNAYVFWGTNALVQSAPENYALLQGVSGNEQGRTFLNSPVDLRLRIRNIDRLTVAADGNVGVGTSTPGHRLEVAGAARVHTNGATHLLVSGAGDDAFIDLIKRTSTASSARIMFDGFTDQTAHQGEIAFLTKHALVPTLTEWMRIKTSGDIGIGTTNPGDRLHIHAGNLRLTRGASWPLILEQTAASVFTIQNGGDVRFVLEPDGLAAISRLRPLADGEYDFGHVCIYPRFPPGATTSQGVYFSRCGSAKEYVPTIDTSAGYPEAGDLVRLVPERRDPYGDERAPFVVAKTETPCDTNAPGCRRRSPSGWSRRSQGERALSAACHLRLFPRQGDHAERPHPPGRSHHLELQAGPRHESRPGVPDHRLRAGRRRSRRNHPGLRPPRRACGAGGQALRAELGEVRAELQQLRRALAR